MHPVELLLVAYARGVVALANRLDMSVRDLFSRNWVMRSFYSFALSMNCNMVIASVNYCCRASFLVMVSWLDYFQ